MNMRCGLSGAKAGYLEAGAHGLSKDRLPAIVKQTESLLCFKL